MNLSEINIREKKFHNILCSNLRISETFFDAQSSTHLAERVTDPCKEVGTNWEQIGKQMKNSKNHEKSKNPQMTPISKIT